MTGPSQDALERCAMVRAALLHGPLTRAEIKQASANDLKSALIRCSGACMTRLITPPRTPWGATVEEGAKTRIALTQFGYRVAANENDPRGAPDELLVQLAKWRKQHLAGGTTIQ